MLTKAELTKVFDTVLSIPGMNETVKIELRLPRKNVLLLSKIIERGITTKEGDDSKITVLDSAPETTLQELLNLAGDLLEKAGLSEMNEKLKSF